MRQHRSKHRPVRGITWTRVLAVLIGGLALILALANCGSGESNPRLAFTPTPTAVKLEAEGPACQNSPWMPWHNSRTTCVEMVYDQVTPPEAAPALMGLALGPDGTLYMARTALGEIWAMRDLDGDQFLDEPHQVTAGLTLPTSLTVYDGALYVASVGGLLRLDATGGGRFDARTVLDAGLAGETGFWPGSVQVGPDGRLYVSLGANCDTCDTDVQPGMLVSYALDGSDRRVEATGLRDPWDFAWQPGTNDLWIVDSGRVVPGLTTMGGPPDELNHVIAGADYGFPYCEGGGTPAADQRPPSSEYCAGTQPPTFTFTPQSSPGGIAFYPYDGFPFWTNDLIVVLRGSWDRPEPAGYALVVVPFGDDHQPGGNLDVIAPSTDSRRMVRSIAGFSLAGMGFFPYHPVDVVVSAEGWLYVSVEEGRILRFRPRPAAQ
jgi:glucose/arabinose dehydrogenase